MKELKKGTNITPAYLRSLITPLFRKINEADPTNIRITAGQVFRTYGPRLVDMLAVYSDQYYRSDKIVDRLDGVDVSYLQKYIDEVTKIQEEV